VKGVSEIGCVFAMAASREIPNIHQGVVKHVAKLFLLCLVWHL
jgi:hypothetical protein